MKALSLLLIIALIFSCSEQKHETLSFELRLAALEDDPNLKEMTMANSEMKFFVDDSVFLQNKDIKSTEIIDWESNPKILVKLNKKGGEKFANFTQQNIGKNAAILAGGKLVSAPRINARIDGGKLIIVGLFTHEEALRIADGILPKQ
jgi:preprotein translocase subunit SecD